MRKELGQALAEYGFRNREVVVLDADVSNSTMTKLFMEAHPDRFFNVGIAEAGMIDSAVGLALGGKIPFASAFVPMICYRGLESIRSSVAYNNANVKILGGYAGVSDYKDGATHHSLFDISTMRAMPNMTVVVAADGMEVRILIPAIAEYRGPVYLRISREDIPYCTDEKTVLEIGKGRMLKEGKDVSIIVTGTPLNRALRASEILAGERISARVVEMHTIKPLDEDLIVDCAMKTGAIVTVEEQTIIGGLFGAVAEVLARRLPTPAAAVGIKDAY